MTLSRNRQQLYDRLHLIKAIQASVLDPVLGIRHRHVPVTAHVELCFFKYSDMVAPNVGSSSAALQDMLAPLSSVDHGVPAK